MSKILTRRNFLKAGVTVVALAALAGGGKAVYDCSSRNKNTNSSGLVKKLELPAGFEEIGRMDSWPMALAGQTKDCASFILREKGGERIFRRDYPDKLGVYLIGKSEVRRVGDLPVSPYDLMPQGISAICQGAERYDCLNLRGFNIEVRKTNINNASSSLMYRAAKRGLTRIEAAAGNYFLLKDDTAQTLLFFDGKDIKEIRFPQGDEWKNVGAYMRANTPPEFKELINDYEGREKTRAGVGAQLEKARGVNYQPVIISLNGVSGDYKAIFGLAAESNPENYRVVRKTIEAPGDKK